MVDKSEATANRAARWQGITLAGCRHGEREGAVHWTRDTDAVPVGRGWLGEKRPISEKMLRSDGLRHTVAKILITVWFINGNPKRKWSERRDLKH